VQANGLAAQSLERSCCSLKYLTESSNQQSQRPAWPVVTWSSGWLATLGNFQSWIHDQSWKAAHHVSLRAKALYKKNITTLPAAGESLIIIMGYAGT
jgi:hypothetical protein